MYKIWIVWGMNSTQKENPDVICYSFESKVELEAFELGIDAAVGYLEYDSFESEEAAKEHIDSLSS